MGASGSKIGHGSHKHSSGSASSASSGNGGGGSGHHGEAPRKTHVFKSPKLGRSKGKAPSAPPLKTTAPEPEAKASKFFPELNRPAVDEVDDPDLPPSSPPPPPPPQLSTEDNANSFLPSNHRHQSRDRLITSSSSSAAVAKSIVQEVTTTAADQWRKNSGEEHRALPSSSPPAAAKTPVFSTFSLPKSAPKTEDSAATAAKSSTTVSPSPNSTFYRETIRALDVKIAQAERKNSFTTSSSTKTPQILAEEEDTTISEPEKEEEEGEEVYHSLPYTSIEVSRVSSAPTITKTGVESSLKDQRSSGSSLNVTSHRKTPSFSTSSVNSSKSPSRSSSFVLPIPGRSPVSITPGAEAFVGELIDGLDRVRAKVERSVSRQYHRLSRSSSVVKQGKDEEGELPKTIAMTSTPLSSPNNAAEVQHLDLRQLFAERLGKEVIAGGVFGVSGGGPGGQMGDGQSTLMRELVQRRTSSPASVGGPGGGGKSGGGRAGDDRVFVSWGMRFENERVFRFEVLSFFFSKKSNSYFFLLQNQIRDANLKNAQNHQYNSIHHFIVQIQKEKGELQKELEELRSTTEAKRLEIEKLEKELRQLKDHRKHPNSASDPADDKDAEEKEKEAESSPGEGGDLQKKKKKDVKVEEDEDVLERPGVESAETTLPGKFFVNF